MARKYRKNFLKTTLYKYKFESTRKNKVEVIPIEVDIVNNGFIIRDEEHSYMDKRILPNRINYLHRSKVDTKTYSYVMYSLTNDEIATKLFLEKMLISAERDVHKSQEAYLKKCKIRDTINNQFQALSIEHDEEFEREFLGNWIDEEEKIK